MGVFFLLILISIFILGLCVGSFLNVLIYRLPRSLSPLKGRSFCPKCKKKIFWYDNIPLLSFILLKGRCRFCHSPIGWQYPLVELITGILTLFVTYYSLVILHLPLLITIYHLLITFILIVIFFTDLLHQIIPDQVVYPAILISLLFAIRYPPYAIPASLGTGAFFLLLHFITRGKGMGLGDVKLAGLMGLVLGFPKIVIALYLAFLTGALVGVILILLGRKRLGDHLAFGPFLAGATWISLFWGEIIWRWLCVQVLPGLSS
jgi:prepilin signal peptidase PulO-like enzyme (type II secretory pathway)